ncbi:outer membrane protein, adhesin transport system [Cognatiyoonia sediminum]|uniref:Outer membrane protein, adhesin transport system n=1 Tax=Cognatiyoonia sediminum TaxID=1508389 RepID=A0A1M5T6N9_9RHOB|nr:TolC family protein [Cognatiyoonia sediminum]SHH46033.1 outer membrane protein, adhesin transport system [Cognatiyoonia sediminum]
MGNLTGLLKATRGLFRLSAIAAFCFVIAGPAQSLTVEEAILFVLETNPEISAAEANKQAIEFELDQARSLGTPRFELEGRAEASINRGTRTSDSTAADGAIGGWEVRGRMVQTLLDGGFVRSEVERQAYRIDGAALRVLERSEFLSLEAVRVYADVLRTRQLVRLARNNVAYHREVFGRIERAYQNGVVGIADYQQAEERVFLADDVLLEFELDAIVAETLFLETVGVDPTNLSSVPSVARLVPATLDEALAKARSLNPTVRFMQADVGAAEALSRRAASELTPDLNLEADVRYGEDIGGFEGEVNDARIGLVLRYDFQGGRKNAAREEQIRRASESRARLLTQVRLVEREVRQSWAALQSAKRRASVLSRQAKLSGELLESYESEFEVGSRSLLDVLNTQNALFQSEANLVNARSTQVFVHYRLLAASGVLLPSFGIELPEDARDYARELERVPGVNPAPTSIRNDARSLSEFRRSLDD